MLHVNKKVVCSLLPRKNGFLFFLLFSLLFPILLVGAKPGSGSDLVVDNTPNQGSGKSCENTKDPYSKIQDAIDAATAGDIISICGGTYTEELEIENKNNLTLIKSSSAASSVVVQNENTILKINGIDGLTIDKIEFDSSDKTAIETENWCDNLVFKNLVVNSDKEDAINIKDEMGEINIQNTVITAENKGIYVEKDLNGFSLTDSNITTSDSGIEFKKKLNGFVTISNISISANGGDGIKFEDDINNGILIENSEINSSKIGIKFKKNIYGSLDIDNVTVNSTEEGISFEGGQSNPIIINSNISSKEKDAIVTKSDDWTNFNLQNSCVKTEKNDKFGFNLNIKELNTNSDISNNCFYAPTNSSLAYADNTGSGSKLNGNYWDGVSGNYTLNNISDTSPLSSCSNSCAPTTPITEYHFGEITIPSGTTTWSDVTFAQSFSSTPVVFSTASASDNEATTVKIKDVTTSGFKIAAVKPPLRNSTNNNGVLAEDMNISYFAISEGTHEINGYTFKAGKISTNKVQSKIQLSGETRDWETIDRSDISGDILVISDTQTMNNEQLNPPSERSDPFCEVAIRHITDSSSFDIALERAETTSSRNDLGRNPLTQNETIGYLIIQDGANGEFSQNGDPFKFEAVRTPDRVTNNNYTVSFSTAFSYPPMIVASQNSRDGGDGGWVRFDNPLPATADVFIDEDKTNDTENSHTTEFVGILAIEKKPLTTPIADYRMDECSWNGTTAEVKDSSVDGIDNSGTITGSVSVSKDGEIYNAGLFAGGAIDIDNLNVSTTSGDKTSVAFWMYRDGTADNMMPFGWGYYDLWFSGGRFGFNTFNSDVYGIADSSILSNGWHHIVAVFNNGDYTQNKIYIDGVSQTLSQQNSYENINYAIVSTSARIGGTRGNNGYRFKGKIDELKIWNGELSSAYVKTIYDNEVSGKNYDGILRLDVCTEEPKNSLFDAWDTFRNINDRNISTKIVSQDFNLTIAALDENNTQSQDFNGTVCTSVVGGTSQTWIKSTFNDINTTTVSYTITNALKNARIDIRWWKNKEAAGVTCSDNSEDNNTLSSDNFAIRPLKFGMDFNTTSFSAGVPFRMDINASGYNGINSVDYNETNNTSFIFDINDSNATCVSGALGNLPNPFKFSDGSISFNTNYSDVGDVLFNIKEINGSEFALVDADDTDDSERLIQEYNTSITVSPYQFAIVDYNFTRSPDQDWRYMSDVNESNIKVSFKVQAENMSGQVTPKFDAQCYANDVNVKINLNSTSSDGNVSYYQLINNNAIYANDRNLSDFNLTGVINKQNFTDGYSSKVVYALNVYRQRNNLINPLDINVSDINTTYTTDVNVKNIGFIPDNNGSKFYYGRVRTQDISTNKSTTQHSLHVEVYSQNPLVAFHQNSLNWYRNSADNITSILDFYPRYGISINDAIDSNIDDIKSTQTIVKGMIGFNITNNTPSVPDSAYIHVEIPEYLWYNRYNDYNATGDCSTHPCFKYNYILDASDVGIESGDFNGTSIGKDYNATKTKKGVKVFR